MGMLDPGHFLISCPECDAWPMAANVRNAGLISPKEVVFVCSNCGFREAAIISASGQLTRLTTLPRRERPRPTQWPRGSARA